MVCASWNAGRAEMPVPYLRPHMRSFFWAGPWAKVNKVAWRDKCQEKLHPAASPKTGFERIPPPKNGHP